jgi:hypothetical protein
LQDHGVSDQPTQLRIIPFRNFLLDGFDAHVGTVRTKFADSRLPLAVTHSASTCG